MLPHEIYGRGVEYVVQSMYYSYEECKYSILVLANIFTMLCQFFSSFKRVFLLHLIHIERAGLLSIKSS